MHIRKLYKYIGRNGSITSPILLDDIKHIPLVELRASAGFVLCDTNGVRKNSVIVHIDDQALWTEVPADINE
jgi:hypothetical protein